MFDNKSAEAEYGSAKVGNRFACGYNTLFWHAFLSIHQRMKSMLLSKLLLIVLYLD